MTFSCSEFKLNFSAHAWLSTWESCSSEVEEIFSSCRDLPQYKYFARPIYKFTVTHFNPVVAVVVTFLAMDLLMHQLFPPLAICALRNIEEYPSSCSISWRPETTFVWSALAIPVMYAKYQKMSFSKIDRIP